MVDRSQGCEYGVTMQFIFFDRNPNLAYQMLDRIAPVVEEAGDQVRVMNLTLDELIEDRNEFDCIVAPGNSFGVMDGGIDEAISAAFPMAQENVTRLIGMAHGGMQPVGTCLTIPTGDGAHPWIAYAPTMRFPMAIPAAYVWDAARAAFRAVRDHPDIESVAFPGLGTATGQVSYAVASEMIALAYTHAQTGLICTDWDQVDQVLDSVETASLPDRGMVN